MAGQRRRGDPVLHRAIREIVVEHRDEWLPGLAGGSEVRLRELSDRPRCRMLTVTVGDAAVPQLLAKVRRDAAPQPAGRPTLATGVLSAAELSALEHDGLCLIAEQVSGDDRFAAVRPVAHLPEHRTVLMEYVEADTLRDRLVRESRVHRLAHRRATEPTAMEVWSAVGGWLALHQRAVPPDGLPARQQTREAVLVHLEACGGFLDQHLGTRAVGDVVARASRFVALALPATLELAVGHGDFAPRNVFALDDGRVAVFDPLFRWAVPRHEDLCRFLVGLRLSGLALHSHGLAHPSGHLEAIETAVIRGYAPDGDPAREQLRAYGLLILIDKWTALVASSRTGLGRLRRGPLRLASSHLRGEVDRLLQAAED